MRGLLLTARRRSQRAQLASLHHRSSQLASATRRFEAEVERASAAAAAEETRCDSRSCRCRWFLRHRHRCFPPAPALPPRCTT